MLKDLKKLADDINEKIQLYEFVDKKLPNSFMKSYSEFLVSHKPNGFSFIQWNQNTAIITTVKNKKIYLPNQWFYIAAMITDYYKAIMEYKEVLDKLFTKTELKTLVDVMKKSDRNSDEYILRIDSFFKNNEQKDFFLKFIIDDKWWGGGKSIDRSDFFESPLMMVGNLLAETQTGIAEITQQFAANDELKNLIIITNDLKIKSNSGIFTSVAIKEFNEKISKCGFKLPEQFSENLIYSIITKPFVIITGNSGTGKTKQAQLLASWLSTESEKTDYRLLFKPGTLVYGKQSVYKILAVDSNSIIVDQSSSSTKTILSFELIEQWVNVIKENKYDEDTASQEIQKKVVEAGISYSTTINSFHSPLKAIAFFIIKNGSGFRFRKNTILQTYVLLPVGAGWTDSRPILGFYNSLQNLYNTTPALELILDAIENPSIPFFLILDEMNLSHVERYFSDFLSAMESGEKIPLHSSSEFVESVSGRSVPAILDVPPNLFVIGTVNVDETTYMFSPKVLDRANVIEFRVNRDNIENFFKKRTEGILEIEPATSGTGEAFLKLTKRARRNNNETPLQGPEKLKLDRLLEVLLEIFEILQESGFEFAYRTADEIIRFAHVSYELANDRDKWNIDDVIDTQILQKLLPKLHGNRKKMESLLAALIVYCEEPDIKNRKIKALEQFKAITVSPVDEKALYKNTHRKLIEMLKAVRRDQFVSFIQ